MIRFIRSASTEQQLGRESYSFLEKLICVSVHIVPFSSLPFILALAAYIYELSISVESVQHRCLLTLAHLQFYSEPTYFSYCRVIPGNHAFIRYYSSQWEVTERIRSASLPRPALHRTIVFPMELLSSLILSARLNGTAMDFTLQTFSPSISSKSTYGNQLILKRRLRFLSSLKATLCLTTATKPWSLTEKAKSGMFTRTAILLGSPRRNTLLRLPPHFMWEAEVLLRAFMLATWTAHMERLPMTGRAAWFALLASTRATWVGMRRPEALSVASQNMRKRPLRLGRLRLQEHQLCLRAASTPLWRRNSTKGARSTLVIRIIVIHLHPPDK